MSNKTIFLVGIPEAHIKKAIERAQKLGIYIILGDTQESLAKYSDLIEEADEKIVVDYTNYEELFKLATTLYKEKHFNAIFTFKEVALYNIAKIQEYLNMKGNPSSSVKACIDKYYTRQILNDFGLLSPNFALCKSVDDIYKFLEYNNLPIIIKPRSQQGSVGVTKISSRAEIAQAFNNCINSNGGENSVLVEEFIYGQEISIEAIVYKGNVNIFGITEKLLYPGTFVESGHISPYINDKFNNDLYKSLVESIVNALDIKFGPLHIEVFNRNNELIVGEVHTRYGGDYIPVITELSMKCDMHTPIFAELLDYEYEINSGKSEGISSIHFLNVKPGKIKSIKGIDEIKKLDNLIDFQLNCNVNDEIKAISSSYDRIGWVLLHGKNRDEIQKCCNEIFDELKIYTE